MMILLLLVILAVPLSAQATVFWDDEMESGDTGYVLPTSPGTPMSYDTSVKFSGNGSTRYNFDASCYPDSSAQSNCGGFMDRNFTNTTTLFTRMYFRMSAGFTVSDVFTKMFRTDTDGIVTNWYTMGCCGSKAYKIHDQEVPPGNVTVQNGNFTFADATWYCIESQETLSTPGSADGVFKIWVDGVQTVNLTNVPFRASGDNSTFYNLRFYRQTGLGNFWFDRVAVGDTRIGCLAGGGGGSTAGGGLDF